MSALAVLWHLVSLLGNLTVMAICALALFGIIEIDIRWRKGPR